MEKTFRRIILVAILFLVAASVYAADTTAGLEEFRKFAAQQMKEDHVPGLSIGFIRWGDGDETVWVEAFGYSDLENQVATKPDSAFRLGSVSKPLTAAAALLLAERGKLDLDADIHKYVPYFPQKKWPITTRQLLGHVGGISHYKDYDVEGRIKEHKTTREAIAIFEQFDLIAEPGTKYSYSSYGYNLLAAIVESAAGMPFADFMAQNIWTPLEMKNTRLDDPTELIPNRVRGYRILNGQIRNSEFVDISSRMGGGGTRSTVPDLLKFAKGLVDGKLLSEKSMELIYTSMATRDGIFTDYSAGWGIRNFNGHFMLRHTGSQQETSTVLIVLPALKFAIASAINQEDAGASVFANRLYELLTGERWASTAYVTSQKPTYNAMNSVFASGLSYFERYKKPMTQDPKELKSALDYFQRSLASSEEKLVSNGAQMVSGQPYTKLGSYMAKALADQCGAERLKAYSASGPFLFFEDFRKLCETNGRKVLACDSSKSFRKTVKNWNDSWTRSNSEEIRRMRINSESNLEETGALLHKAFDSSSAYPDYSLEFGNLTWNSLLKGENEKSLRAGELGAGLYPESARLLAMYAISLAALSDTNRGITYLQKAYKLDPEGPAEPDWLSDFAEELALAGKTNEAVKVLEAGIQVHPKEPQLLSDLGEAYLANKDTARAKEYFEKALALNPELERAKKMLDQISKQ